MNTTNPVNQVRQFFIGRTVAVQGEGQWIPIGEVADFSLGMHQIILTVRDVTTSSTPSSPIVANTAYDSERGPLTELDRIHIKHVLKILRLSHADIARQMKQSFPDRYGSSRSWVGMVLNGQQGMTDSDVGFRFRTVFEALLRQEIQEGILTSSGLQRLIERSPSSDTTPEASIGAASL